MSCIIFQNDQINFKNLAMLAPQDFCRMSDHFFNMMKGLSLFDVTLTFRYQKTISSKCEHQHLGLYYLVRT